MARSGITIPDKFLQRVYYINQYALDCSSGKEAAQFFTHYTSTYNPTVDDECVFMKNRDEIKEIINRCGNVKAVISGHLHEKRVIRENGVDYYVIPSMIADNSNDGCPLGSHLNIETEDEELTLSFMTMNKEDLEKKINISGAIFDMDGTLVDSLGFWDYLWESLGTRYLGNRNFRPDEITAKGVRTSTLYGAARLIHENCGIAESTDELFTVVDEMLKNYYTDAVELKEGAEELLNSLKEKGVKMCIATATAPHLLKVLMDKFNLYRFFEKAVSCNEVGKGKEHPDVFVRAHEYLGTKKEETFIFEDSVVALESAVRAGYNTVGVYDKYGFSPERVKELSKIHIGKEETLRKVMKMI